jgi:hypothetical protein
VPTGQPRRFSLTLPLVIPAVLLGLAIYVPPSAAQSDADGGLRRIAAELLPRVEELSGIRATRPLGIATRTREELRAHLLEQMVDEQAMHEMRMVNLVYQRLGLLDAAADLSDASRDLLVEQVAGYYDAERDSLFVLGDVPDERIRSILVHEMVHALQDQLVPLDSLLNASGDSDRASAVRAAIEGHAELVELHFYIEELSAQRGVPIPVPDMTLTPLELFFEDNPRPMLAAAPAIVRDGLIFPYIRGAGFVQALRRRDPTGVPLFERMPVSTEQVLDPDGRFFDRLDPPLELHFLSDEDGVAACGSAGTAVPWVLAYENTLGEFQISVLLRERHSVIGIEKFAIGWAGDRYRLYADGDRQVLVWYVAWDDPRAAWNFANSYRQILHLGLNRTGWVDELLVDGRSVVRIVEASEPMDQATLPKPAIAAAPGQ